MGPTRARGEGNDFTTVEFRILDGRHRFREAGGASLILLSPSHAELT